MIVPKRSKPPLPRPEQGTRDRLEAAIKAMADHHRLPSRVVGSRYEEWEYLLIVIREMRLVAHMAIDALLLIEAGPPDDLGPGDGWAAGVALSALCAIREGEEDGG